MLTIVSPDISELERIAHSDTLPWYQVRRARIVLGIAAGQRREDIAFQLECDESTIWRTCQRYRHFGLGGLLADQRQGHSGRDLQITPVQRAQIVELACLEPVAKGLHITHWSSDDLARQAVADGIVARISPRTVRDILSDVDLQPHRTRYWKTARLDARFKERAEQVLWCYGNAARLAEQGIWVCVSMRSQPSRSWSGSDPPSNPWIDRATGVRLHPAWHREHVGVPGSPYRADGLVFLTKNDHEHYLPELELFRRQHKELRGVFLIQDGGASHIAAGTQSYFAKSQRWWKPRYTPANASWLNQAEILIHAFKHYYLKRASWKSQEEFKTHVLASWPEYNHRYAHPFEWTWTNQKMRRWFAKHAS